MENAKERMRDRARRGRGGGRGRGEEEEAQWGRMCEGGRGEFGLKEEEEGEDKGRKGKGLMDGWEQSCGRRSERGEGQMIDICGSENAYRS